jgi:hypothetical protein
VCTCVCRCVCRCMCACTCVCKGVHACVNMCMQVFPKGRGKRISSNGECQLAQNAKAAKRAQTTALIVTSTGNNDNSGNSVPVLNDSTDTGRTASLRAPTPKTRRQCRNCGGHGHFAKTCLCLTCGTRGGHTAACSGPPLAVSADTVHEASEHQEAV